MAAGRPQTGRPALRPMQPRSGETAAIRNGKQVTWKGMAVYHPTGSNIDRVCGLNDALGIMQQLGAIPSDWGARVTTAAPPFPPQMVRRRFTLLAAMAPRRSMYRRRIGRIPDQVRARGRGHVSYSDRSPRASPF